MSEEKCFCHLNGYKVKDADARKQIENLALQVTTNGANIGELESDLATLNNRVTSNSANIGELESDLTTAKANIGELESDLQEKDLRLQQNIEGISSNLGTKIDELKTRVTIVENQSNSSTGEIADLRQRVTSHDNRILALENRGGLTLYKHLVSVTPDTNPDMGAPTFVHTIISTRETEYTSMSEIVEDWENGLIIRAWNGYSGGIIISLVNGTTIDLVGTTISSDSTGFGSNYIIGDVIS